MNKGIKYDNDMCSVDQKEKEKEKKKRKREPQEQNTK